MTESADGCRFLVEVYASTHIVDRLQWAAEACLHGGQQIPEAYAGWAAAREMIGQDGDAIRILTDGKRAFPLSPIIPLQLARIYRRNGTNGEAGVEYGNAVVAAPDNAQIAHEAMVYYFLQNRLQDALEMARRFNRTSADKTAEMVLMAARVQLKAGDRAGSRETARLAEPLLAGRADAQAVRLLYDDVYKGEEPRGTRPPNVPPPPGSRRTPAHGG
jgi:hypothetical protein